MEPTTPVSLVIIAKNLSFVVTFMVAMEYLHLNGTAVSILAFLLIVDFCTGVLRAALVDGRHAIRSSVALRGTLAKLLTFLVPFIVALAGKGVGLDLSAVAVASVSIFILSTLYSTLGNIHSISTGKPKVEIDALEYIYKQAGAILKKALPDEV
jgi:phage-related holin